MEVARTGSSLAVEASAKVLSGLGPSFGAVLVSTLSAAWPTLHDPRLAPSALGVFLVAVVDVVPLQTLPALAEVSATSFEVRTEARVVFLDVVTSMVVRLARDLVDVANEGVVRLVGELVHGLSLRTWALLDRDGR